MTLREKKAKTQFLRGAVYGFSAVFCFVATWRHGDPTDGHFFMPCWFDVFCLLTLYPIPFIFALLSFAYCFDSFCLWCDSRKRATERADAGL